LIQVDRNFVSRLDGIFGPAGGAYGGGGGAFPNPMNDVTLVVLYVEENQGVGIAPIDFGDDGVFQLDQLGIVVGRAAVMREHRSANRQKTKGQSKRELSFHTSLLRTTSVPVPTMYHIFDNTTIGDWPLERLAARRGEKASVWEETKKGRFYPPPFCLERGRNLADGSAGDSRTRTGGVHADHAGLIGEVHTLSGGSRSDRSGRDGVRLIARARAEHKRVAALASAREHRVNQVRRRGTGRAARGDRAQVSERRRELAIAGGVSDARCVQRTQRAH